LALDGKGRVELGKRKGVLITFNSSNFTVGKSEESDGEVVTGELEGRASEVQSSVLKLLTALQIGHRNGSRKTLNIANQSIYKQ
jgi:hypothetical protein